MPVSAYLKSGLFVVAAAAALFAAAGTLAIASFWVYLAILAAVMIVSFAALDPELLRERMRPGGKKPPLALRVLILLPVRYCDYRQILPCVANNRGLMPCPRTGAMPNAEVTALPARSSDAGTTYLNRL